MKCQKEEKSEWKNTEWIECGTVWKNDEQTEVNMKKAKEKQERIRRNRGF